MIKARSLLTLGAMLWLGGCLVAPRSAPAPVDGGSNGGGRPILFILDCLPELDGGACAAPVDDRMVDFGWVRSDACRSAEITVENVGDAPLVVDAPFFPRDSSPEFRFEGAAPGGFTLAGGERQILRVSFCPFEPGDVIGHPGSLILPTNDATAGDAAVELRGFAIATDQPCVCQNYSPEMEEVAPFTPLPLSLFCPTGPQRGVSYDWTVTSAPVGATATLTPASGTQVDFTADLVTDNAHPYQVQMTATNSAGLTSTCEFDIFVVPHAALNIELVSADSSPALDLQLLRSEEGSTCWRENPNPDWGVADAGIDDPLWRGDGPQTIAIRSPAAGRYTVGVHRACASPDGGSPATIRVYCNGALSFTRGPTMPDAGTFWTVGTLDWPGCTFTPIDRETTEPAETCGP